MLGAKLAAKKTQRLHQFYWRVPMQQREEVASMSTEKVTSVTQELTSSDKQRVETKIDKWRQVVGSGDKCGYESGDVGYFDGWQRWRWSGGRDKSGEEHWKLCRLCKSFKIRVSEVHLRRIEHNIRNVTFERKLKKRHQNCRDEYRKVYWFMKRYRGVTLHWNEGEKHP